MEYEEEKDRGQNHRFNLYHKKISTLYPIGPIPKTDLGVTEKENRQKRRRCIDGNGVIEEETHFSSTHKK